MGDHVYSEPRGNERNIIFDTENHNNIGDLITNSYEIEVPGDSLQTYEIHTLPDDTAETEGNIIYITSNGEIVENELRETENHPEDVYEEDKISCQNENQEEIVYEEVVQEIDENIVQTDNINELNDEEVMEDDEDQLEPPDDVVETIETVINQPTDKNLAPIKCVLCKDEFANFSIFRDHLFKFHINGKLFKCKDCDKQFDFRQDLKKHETNHTGVKYFNCEYCGKGFLKRNIYEGHLLIHTGDTLPYQCAYCDRKFRLKEPATLHIWRHEADETNHVECFNCTLAFYTELSLRSHENGNKNCQCDRTWKGVSYTCEICQNIYFKRLDYVLHLKADHPDNYFVKLRDVNCCVKCGEICNDDELVAKHIKTHKMKDNFQINCQICGKTIRGRGAYTLHMKWHKNKPLVDSEPSTSKVKSASTKSKSVTVNKKVNKSATQPNQSDEELSPFEALPKDLEKPETSRKKYDIELIEFNCESCLFKCLMTRLGIENHVNSHVREPPLECDRCHASFTVANDWIFHNYQCYRCMHDAEIPCPACTTSLDTLRGLKIHLRVMHKEHLEHQMRVDNVEFIKCNICHKDFLTEASLRFHKRSHKTLDNKPKTKDHQCPFCLAMFSTSLTLLVHKRGHTGERPFSCRFCGKTFKDRTSLRSHCIIHTKNFRHFCEHCQKGFVTPYKLKIHNERTHLRGIKPPKPKTPKVKARVFRGSDDQGNFILPNVHPESSPTETVYIEGQF